MTQVSKRVPKPQISRRLDHLLEDVFSTAKSSKEASQMIFQILTATEQTMITKRIAISLMLYKGFGYETINQTLKVSFPTISKVREWMRYKGGTWEELLKRIVNKQQTKRFFAFITESAEEVLISNRPGTSWKQQGRIRKSVRKTREQRHEVVNKL